MNLMVDQHKSSYFNCVYVKLKLATLSSLMYSEEFDAQSKFIKNIGLINILMDFVP